MMIIETTVRLDQEELCEILTAHMATKGYSVKPREIRFIAAHQDTCLLNAVNIMADMTIATERILSASEQRQSLYRMMRNVSASYWNTEWQPELEFILWGLVASRRCKWWDIDIADTFIQSLSDLSDGCGGWFCWPTDQDAGEPEFVEMQEWRNRFEQWSDALPLGEVRDAVGLPSPQFESLYVPTDLIAEALAEVPDTEAEAKISKWIACNHANKAGVLGAEGWKFIGIADGVARWQYQGYEPTQLAYLCGFGWFLESAKLGCPLRHDLSKTPRHQIEFVVNSAIENVGEEAVVE